MKKHLLGALVGAFIMHPLLGMKFENESWRFDDSDATGHYLVQTRSHPFTSRELKPFDCFSSRFNAPENEGDIYPDLNPCLIFSVDGIFPKRFMDLSSEEIALHTYAVLIPMTKERMQQAKTLFPVTFLGPMDLPDDALFVGPEGGSFPEFGQKTTYDQSSETSIQCIHRVLEEKKLQPFSMKPNRQESLRPYYQGKPFKISSMRKVFDLSKERADLLVEQSGLAFFTETEDFMPTDLFEDKIKNPSLVPKSYFSKFMKGCVFDLCMGIENATVMFRNVLTKYNPSEAETGYLETRIQRLKDFHSLWLHEKELVLTQRKSFLRSPAYLETLKKGLDKPLDALKADLESIAVPYDFHKVLEKYRYDASFTELLYDSGSYQPSRITNVSSWAFLKQSQKACSIPVIYYPWARVLESSLDKKGERGGRPTKLDARRLVHQTPESMKQLYVAFKERYSLRDYEDIFSC